MSAYVNRLINHTGADATPVQMNRWSQPGNYTFQIIGGTWDLGVTLEQLNRFDEDLSPFASWQTFSVIDDTGATVTSTGLGIGTYIAPNMPAEFILCSSSGAGVMNIMQNGSSGG